MRHLDIKKIGCFAWIPYAFSGAGCLGGGWLGTWLIRRRFSLNAPRKITMGVGAALVPASLFIVAAPLHYAIVFFSVALFAHQFWSSGILTLPSDFFPANAVGSVSGLVGSAGSFGETVFGLVVGWLVEGHGYGRAFLIAGLLHPLAFAIVLATSLHIGPRLIHQTRSRLHLRPPQTRSEICHRKRRGATRPRKNHAEKQIIRLHFELLICSIRFTDSPDL